ncbi:amidase [Hwanghaeella grinnelliae]|uniref:Amidase n=1 Tax=Hwanghaeella grinnelliae TaxID=2500179 RepID=A0A437QQP4_9PROT|nr:amidase [Hwanghaeella grinnelliae]RVU36845.1 amidase [Hwanghaeella grinnelliae]
MKPIAELVEALEKGEATSLALADECLERIADPAGEGGRVFLSTDPERVRAQARAMDEARKAGKASSPLTGVPVSIKALFDIEGEVTTAGSAVLRNAPPAETDAEVVRRLRAAGLVILGHTNMTEFAYSGLGINPHYDTPRNPVDREGGRIPGGSSSGAAISVTDGMAAMGLGTDTGGSCRIPASFCGIVGFKPTARRVPQQGTYPLSKSFDSIGPLARSVDCCIRIDAILAGDATPIEIPDELFGLRIGVLRHYALDGIEPAVADAFEKALRAIEQAGARLTDISLPDFDRVADLNARGGIIGAEAWRLHKEMIAEHGVEYDPRVRVRIEKAREQEEGEYEALLNARQEIIDNADTITTGFDAVVMPTTPIQAPLIADLMDESDYGRLNLLALRNPTIANFLDRCAISVPMPTGNGMPAGFMLMGETMADKKLLGLAQAVERVLGTY